MQELKRTTRKTARALVETVDNWHRAWPKVLEHIVRCGEIAELSVDLDGWLSARQVVVAAFVGDAIAAHACFAVEPAKTGVKARIVSRGIEPRYRGRGIEAKLRNATILRAKELNCRRARGFKLAGAWC